MASATSSEKSDEKKVDRDGSLSQLAARYNYCVIRHPILTKSITRFVMSEFATGSIYLWNLSMQSMECFCDVYFAYESAKVKFHRSGERWLLTWLPNSAGRGRGRGKGGGKGGGGEAT